MIKQKIQKIEILLGKIINANRKEFVITRFLNRKDKPDYYEYKNKNYNSLEELKAENGITENDNILTINLVMIYTQEDIKKFKNI